MIRGLLGTTETSGFSLRPKSTKLSQFDDRGVDDITDVFTVVHDIRSGERLDVCVSNGRNERY